MELYSQKKVKTRKKHKCFICHQNIPAKVECLYERGRYEGEFFSRYSHNECANAWIEFNEDAGSNDDWYELHDSDNYREHCDMIRVIYEKKFYIIKTVGVIKKAVGRFGPFSHNIVSMALRDVSNKYSTADANKIVRDMGLCKYGFSEVEND